MDADRPIDRTLGADERFDVYLPVNDQVDREGATHVVHMRGDEHAFVDVLAEMVRTRSDLSAPLRSAVEASGLDHLTAELERLGPARVESVDVL